MCLIVLDWQPSQNRWLTLASNRDEFHHRQSDAMQPWADDNHLLAGRDHDHGGSWLAVDDHLRFAAITNVRDGHHQPAEPPATSRGELVVDYLQGSLSPSEFCTRLLRRANQFAPFNLLVGDPENLWYATNHPIARCQALPPGRHALSNAALNADWPKTQLACQQLQQWQDRHHHVSATCALPSLATLLDRQQPWPDRQLPDTGVPLDWERLLSAQKIISPQYGTHCSTAVIAEQQTLTSHEVRWSPTGQQTGYSQWQTNQQGHRRLPPQSPQAQ